MPDITVTNMSTKYYPQSRFREVELQSIMDALKNAEQQTC